MRKLIIFGAFAVLLMFMAARLYQRAHQPGLAVLGAVPAFSLTDTEGRAVSDATLKGRVWVVNFVFTRCAGPCPLLTARLSAIAQGHRSDPRFHAVSLSVDPEYDTPTVLRSYAQRYRANTDLWHFLTGTPTMISNLMVQGFKIGTGETMLFHSNRFVLVDKDLQIRGYYDGQLPEDMDRLKGDVGRLLRETPS